LLKNGADCDAPGFGGNTPLHLVVRHGQVSMVELLSLGMANVDIPNAEGETAAGIALNAGYPALWDAIRVSTVIRDLFALAAGGQGSSSGDEAGSVPLRYSQQHNEPVYETEESWGEGGFDLLLRAVIL